MNQNVFVGLMIALFAAAAISILLLCYNPSYRQEPRTLTPSDVSDLGYGVYRFENSEVVCYTSARGLQCKFK